MALLPLAAGLSLLLRLTAYIYLRWIPLHRFARFLLPGLYIGFLGAVTFSTRSNPPVVVVEEKVEVVDVVDVKTEQVVEEVVALEGTALVDPANGRPHKASSPPRPRGFSSILADLIAGFSTHSSALNIVGILVNTLTLLLAADFAYSPLFKSYNPTFTRVGALDHSSAKILVRYPDFEAGHLRVVWQRIHPALTNGDVWKEGPILDIEEEKDWTATGKITNLWPSAEYAYRLAYLNSTLLPYPEVPIVFKTFPDPKSSAGTHFKFVFTSCMLPNFPYNPLFPERIKGLDILSDWIDSFRPQPLPPVPAAPAPAEPVEEEESVISDVSTAVASATETLVSEEMPFVSSLLTEKPRDPPPEFMILAGDAIYADVPYWNGDDLEAYRKLYRRTFASPSYRKVYEKLPVFGIYDDHEFLNNWTGENDDAKAPFVNASTAYATYYGAANPDPQESDVSYYELRFGDNAFFVLDTRRHRSLPETDPESTTLPTMLGEKQLHDLHSWLGRVNSTATFKFIVSSVPFTSLWHGWDGQKDTWAGYRIERDSLLDVLQYIPNVVILSGDRHEFAFIEHRAKIPEISVGPLSQFAVPSMSLRSHSDRFMERGYIDTLATNKDGAAVSVEATEVIPEERSIQYIPGGNYKFVSLEVDTRDWRRPTFMLDLLVNGKSAYQFEFVGQPVALSYTSSLAVSFGGVWKGMLNKIGLMRSVV